jgi:hypothetical protein
MDRKLTAADLADYRVDITTVEGTQSRTVRAAYTTTEPGWLLLKDDQHRTVAQFHDHIVVMVERLEQAEPAPPSDEDRIRDAMTEATDHPGRVITR